MYALLTVLVLAQTSVSVQIGGPPKKPAGADSAVQIQREDSIIIRRDVRRDSMRVVNKVRDSARIERRRAKRIAVTPALVASAFRDSRAATLLAAARTSRLEQDSTLRGYDATSYERLSVGIGLKRIGRERLLMRTERVGRVTWQRGGPALVQILGKRHVMPMLEGAGDTEIESYDIPIPYYPGRETLWVGSGIAKSDINESEIIHPLARGAEAYYTYATGDSVSFQLPGSRRIELRELVVRPRAPAWNVALGSLWFDVASARLVRAVYRLPSRWISGRSPMKRKRIRTTSRRNG